MLLLTFHIWWLPTGNFQMSSFFVRCKFWCLAKFSFKWNVLRALVVLFLASANRRGLAEEERSHRKVYERVWNFWKGKGWGAVQGISWSAVRGYSEGKITTRRWLGGGHGGPAQGGEGVHQVGEACPAWLYDGVGVCRTRMGPDLVFVVLDMSMEDQIERLRKRHKGDETALQTLKVWDWRKFFLIYIIFLDNLWGLWGCWRRRGKHYWCKHYDRHEPGGCCE